MRRRLAPLLALLLLALAAVPAAAQSQAANGTIEGTVRDTSGAVLPGVTVAMTNIDTGAERIVLTNESGFYRAPLLPLGSYRVVAELAGFKRYEQTGIDLGAGRTAVIDITLSVGDVSETVAVTADAPIVDPAKIDLGRNLNEREVKNLPLVSRNPYNFALLQPGVTGYENSEFGVPRFSANGTLLRVNYQIDGNTNTQKDRAGLRLLPDVRGHDARGQGRHERLRARVRADDGPRVQRDHAVRHQHAQGIGELPLPPQGLQRAAVLPDQPVDRAGGGVVQARHARRQRHRRGRRADREGPAPLLRGLREHRRATSRRTASSRSPPRTPRASAWRTAESSGVIPAEQTARFLIGKLDYQLNPANRLTARYILFRNDSPNNIGRVGRHAQLHAVVHRLPRRDGLGRRRSSCRPSAPGC